MSLWLHFPSLLPVVTQASTDRIASFQKVIERSHSQVTSLKASVNNIFQAVSAKRFRDVAPDIRALVIEGIAHWTSSLPAHFLQDQYLKYVAWALSDRVSSPTICMLLLIGANKLHQDCTLFSTIFAEHDWFMSALMDWLASQLNRS